MLLMKVLKSILLNAVFISSSFASSKDVERTFDWYSGTHKYQIKVTVSDDLSTVEEAMEVASSLIDQAAESDRASLCTGRYFEWKLVQVRKEAVETEIPSFAVVKKDFRCDYSW